MPQRVGPLLFPQAKVPQSLFTSAEYAMVGRELKRIRRGQLTFSSSSFKSASAASSNSDHQHIFARREGSSSLQSATRSLITWIRRDRPLRPSAPPRRAPKKASAIRSCSALVNAGLGGCHSSSLGSGDGAPESWRSI